MKKIHLEIEDRQLALAQEALGTATESDTVDQALKQVVALAARRRDLDRLRADAFADLRDPEVMSKSWLR